MTGTIKISELPNAGVLSGTERVALVQDNTTKQATTAQIADLAGTPASTAFIYPSGSDDTATINAAFATDATRFVFQPGADYIVNGALELSVATQARIIEGNGATIDFSGGTNTGVMLTVSGTETVIGTLSANASPGATTLTMTTTSGLAAGDWIVVYSNITNSWASGVAVGEMVRVLSVDSGTVVTLETALRFSYQLSGTVTIGDSTPVSATISVASPAVVTTGAAHELAVNQPLTLATTGALPTGLATLTTYYVRTVLSPTTFTVSATLGGLAINTTAAGSGSDSYILNQGVTWTGHSVAPNQQVQLTTTGTLPTGYSPATTYYVKAISGWTFTLAATSGGTAITATAPGSGVQTCTATTVSYSVVKVVGHDLKIDKLNVIGSAAGAAGRQVGIRVSHARVEMSDVDLYGFDFSGIDLRRVPSGVIERPRVRNGRGTPGLAYGVVYGFASRAIRITNGYFEELRHGVTGGGSQGVSIDILATGNACYAMREAGLDAHPSCVDVNYSHNYVEAATDAESDGDGIICQGPYFIAANNIIVRARRHGIIHQASGGQQQIVPVGLIQNNIISGSGTTGSRAGIITQPSNSNSAPGKYYVLGNTGDGSSFTTAIHVDTQFDNVSYIEIISNDIPGSATRGLHVQADVGLVQLGGVVAFNRLGGGTSEAFYLQGSSTGRVKNMLVAYNTSYGGSYALRMLNCENVRFGQMLGEHVAFLSSGLTNCRALGGPNTPMQPESYTVAQLTSGLAASFSGATVWCSNARKNGEGVGVGTGLPALSLGSAWVAIDTNLTLVTPTA